MKRKSLTIALIIGVVLAALLLGIIALIAAKNDTPNSVNLNQATEAQGGSTHKEMIVDPTANDYCALSIDNWSAENGVLTINAFAQAVLSTDATASARIEMWTETATLATYPITLHAGEEPNIYETDVSLQFEIPELKADEELQLWFIIDLSDGTVVFSSDAGFYMEDGQLMIIAG